MKLICTVAMLQRAEKKKDETTMYRFVPVDGLSPGHEKAWIEGGLVVFDKSNKKYVVGEQYTLNWEVKENG